MAEERRNRRCRGGGGEEWGEKEEDWRWKKKGTESDAKVYAIFSCRKEKDKIKKVKQGYQKSARNQGYINNIYLTC